MEEYWLFTVMQLQKKWPLSLSVSDSLSLSLLFSPLPSLSPGGDQVILQRGELDPVTLLVTTSTGFSVAKRLNSQLLSRAHKVSWPGFHSFMSPTLSRSSLPDYRFAQVTTLVPTSGPLPTVPSGNSFPNDSAGSHCDFRSELTRHLLRAILQFLFPALHSEAQSSTFKGLSLERWLGGGRKSQKVVPESEPCVH